MNGTTVAHRLQHVQTLEGHQDRVWHLAWSPDGTSLASCSSDRTVRIWQKSRQEVVGWRCVAVLEDTHTKSIRWCCWSPGGIHLATASFDGTTAIWQVQRGMWEEVCKLEGHENEVKAVAWSPCGNYLATCGRDKTVWFWERGLGEEYDCMDVKHGHSQDVKSIAWHPTKELLASCSYDNTVKLWVNDEGDWICTQTLEGPAVGHSSTVWSVAFSQDGKHLASVSDDCTLKVWDLQWDSEATSIDPHATLAASISGNHQRTIFTVDWSTDGVIATGDGANSIKLFGQDNGQQAGSDSNDYEAAAGRISAPAAGSEQHRQCSTSAAADAAQSTPHEHIGELNDKPAAPAAWDLLCGIDQAHDADVNCVKWHPKQQGLLASCGDDNVIKLWVYQ